MSFGTKPKRSMYRPLILATQNLVETPASKPTFPAIDRDHIEGAHARYFSNASDFMSSGALRRHSEPSKSSQVLTIVASLVITGIFVLGVIYWATNGMLNLPNL